MSLLMGFSGQGSQHPKMFERLKNNSKGKSWLEEASDILHLNFLEEYTVEKYLYDPIYAQVMIVLLSVGVFRLIEQENIECLLDVRFCGYSLGEASAFCASAKLSLKEIVEIIGKRAALMKGAADLKGEGGLVVLKGSVNADMIEDLTHQFHCYIAIINDKDHYILGGLKTNLDVLLQKAKEKGVKKVEHLSVSLPSHTPLLKDASENFMIYLQKFQHKELHYPILTALTGESLMTSEKILPVLANELSQTLQWQKVMAIAKEYGITRFLELGPKSALKNMALPYFSEVYSLEDFATIEGLIHYFS